MLRNHDVYTGTCWPFPDSAAMLQVDDDVIINVKALAEYLRERRTHGNLYMVR